MVLVLFFLYIPPLNIYHSINIIFITFFLFSEDPKELNTTSPANPNTVQKEGKVTTRTCFFVLFVLFFSDQKCKLTKERNYYKVHIQVSQSLSGFPGV